MSPAKSKKAKSAPRKAGKKAGKAARPAAKARTASKRANKGKSSPKPAAAKGAVGHAHCAATDPFGDVCQNLPRRPSKYCVIHSYLDR